MESNINQIPNFSRLLHTLGAQVVWSGHWGVPFGLQALSMTSTNNLITSHDAISIVWGDMN